MNKKMRISFAGCGFMGVYHIGVGHCLYERVPDLVDNLEGFYGTSAGAIMAVCMACGTKTKDGNLFVTKATDMVHKSYLGAFGPQFNPSALIEEFLESTMPEDAHRFMRNVVEISMTELPSMKSKRITDFNTRKEVIKAVAGSSFIPGFSGFSPPILRGKRVIDGGFSDNIPHRGEEDVITVAPFPGDFDICPSEDPHHHMQHYFQVANMGIQFNVTNWWRLKQSLLAPTAVELQKIQREGYIDTLRFLNRKGYISDPIPRPYMELKDCIEVPRKAVSSVKQEKTESEKRPSELKLEELNTEVPMIPRRCRSHRESMTSDYFSETTTPDLSRSVSLSNVELFESKLDSKDPQTEEDTTDDDEDIGPLEDSLLHAKALCTKRRSTWTMKDMFSHRVVSYLWNTVYSTAHAKDKQYIQLVQKVNTVWYGVLSHTIEPLRGLKT